MGYRFVFTTSAKNDVSHLDEAVRRRLGIRLREYETSDTTIAHIKKLHDHPIARYRLRIGDYRLLMDKEGDVFVVLRVRHRKDAYR